MMLNEVNVLSIKTREIMVKMSSEGATAITSTPQDDDGLESLLSCSVSLASTIFAIRWRRPSVSS